MGKDTVQNQNRSVATKGSLHVARTQGPCDMCHPVPDPSKVQPFDNWVPTTDLAKGKTNITLIASHAIWTEPGEIGPPSNDVHPPFTMGVTSAMIYRQEAMATSWSADVFAEGNAVVRSNDCTTMNHANTVGYVDGSALGEGADNAEPWVKDKCGIVSLKGKEGERELGFERGKNGPADEKHYIEVLSQDEIELEVTREDLTKAGQEERAPACAEPGTHASWLITKSRGKSTVDEEKIDGKDKITVIADDIWAEATDLLAAHKPAVGWEDDYGGGHEVSGAQNTFPAVIQYFRYRRNPYRITCVATACAGPRQADIRVFPQEKIDFSLALGEEEEGEGGIAPLPGAWGIFVKTLATLKKLVDLTTRVRSYLSKGGGEHGTYLASGDSRLPEVKFLVGATANLKVEYKRIKEAKHGFKPNHVGMPWSLTLKAGPLLYFSITWTLDLLSCTLAIVGKIAAWLLERLGGAGIELVLTFTINVSLDFALDIDEYWQCGDTGAYFPVDIRFEAGIQVNYRKWSVRAGMGATTTVKIGLFYPNDDVHLIELGIRGKLTPDFFIRATKNGDVKWEKKAVIESWEVPFKTPALKLLSTA